MNIPRIGLAALVAAAPLSVQAQTRHDAPPVLGGPAVGVDLFHSSDADNTEVTRLGFDFDISNSGPEKYRGIRLEKARYNPVGQGWKDRTRGFIRGADVWNDNHWNWNVGTDGTTVIGSASVYNEELFRKELFVERDILETPTGLKRGIYYTFVGFAVDLPANDRNVFTATIGAQRFTGDNLRTHLRASYIHVLAPDLGISAQLRTRYFQNSDPREFDYYSPRWYAQVLPVLQMRRFTPDGWRYLAAIGLGVQRDNVSGWRRSSLLNLQATSPERDRWAFTANFLYSETPTTAGTSYRYGQVNVGLRWRF